MVTFRVPDMTCGHCASSIARAVAAVDPTARIDVSIAEKRVSIASAATGAELAEAVREAGYTPEQVGAPTAPVSQRAGCCCGNRKAAPVDLSQAAAEGGESCCA